MQLGSYQIMKNGKLLTQIPIVSAKEVIHMDSSAKSKETRRISLNGSFWVASGILLIICGSFGLRQKRKQRRKTSVDALP